MTEENYNVKQIVLTILIITTAVICVFLYKFYHATHRFLEHERSTAAWLVVCDVVGEHISTTGEWPSGWSDLLGYTAVGGNSLAWPRDADAIREYIDIDFTFELVDGPPDVLIDIIHADPTVVPTSIYFGENSILDAIGEY